MPGNRTNNPTGRDPRFFATLLVLLAIVIILVTWIGIRENRSDSLQLLRMQGSAFAEALAQAAESAMASESFVDFLIHLRYAEIVRNVTRHNLKDISDQLMVQTAVAHDLYGLFILDSTATLSAGGIARGPTSGPPQFVFDEAMELLSQPENRYVLLLDEGDSPGEIIHYYLELTNNLQWVIVLAADAQYYIEALRETQIGYLAQNMAREKGVEYILYQSTEGIIFASRKTGQLLAIESDPFLTESLDSDSIRYRTYEFQEKQVLELIRPFASEDYPFGLLRVGLSLDGYYTVSSGFDRLMLSLAAVMFGLILVGLLYLRGRRKRRELSVQYSQIKTTTDRIFDEMRTGVAVVDHEGTVTLVNAAFENVFDASDMMGQKLSEVVSEPQLNQTTVGTGKDTSAETELKIKRNGTTVHLLVATSPLQLDNTELPGTVIVVYNVTRLKQFEREAARRERLSEMGHLAAGVAHEIRNPLNTISIAAQRLASEFTPDQNQEEYTAMTSQIRQEAMRLNDIITRFLALAREEKKRFKPVVLDKLIEEFAHFIKPEAEKLSIELSIDLASENTIQADEDSLKQVFTNLFNNAKEALNGQAGNIRITTKLVNDKVQIILADSGPGIEVSIRDKVFTPYFTTKDAGTGLGLPTIHKIISEMNGEITVTDSDLGGAAFVITLPIHS